MFISSASARKIQETFYAIISCTETHPVRQDRSCAAAVMIPHKDMTCFSCFCTAYGGAKRGAGLASTLNRPGTWGMRLMVIHPRNTHPQPRQHRRTVLEAAHSQISAQSGSHILHFHPRPLVTTSHPVTGWRKDVAPPIDGGEKKGDECWKIHCFSA